MKLYTFLIALYGPHEAHILFPSYAECSAALQPTQAVLEASYDDVAVLCDRTRPTERIAATEGASVVTCCNHDCHQGRTCPHRKTPVYDAEYFEPSAKRQRGLALGWNIALLFVLLTGLLIAVIGYLTI